MARDRRTQAERWRDHRAAFTLALELHITPRQAEEELARRDARATWREAQQRLAARKAGRAPDPQLKPQPWWLKD